MSVRRGGDVGLGLEGPAQRPFHVGLAAANPDLAHQHVVSVTRLVRRGDGERVRPAGFEGRSLTDHFKLCVVVETVCPRNLTVTFSPSSAQPQMVTGTPCCRTMWSENKAGS